MKKVMLILLSLLLALPTAHAEGENNLLRHAVELGRELDALAEDEERIRLYTTGAEVLSMVRAYGAGSHEEPCEVRAVVLDEILALMSEEMAELPDSGKRQVQNMLPGVLKQGYINGFGVNAVVASTILNASVTFSDDQARGMGLWILLYEDAAPIAVSWYAENGAVRMEAAFLPANYQQGEGLPFETRTIAAVCPELDQYAQTLAKELQELAGNEQYLMLLGLSSEVLGTVKAYAAEENQTPSLMLCALTDGNRVVSAQLTQQIGYLGDSYLAAAGSMHSSVIFADAEASGNGLYLFLYEDSTPIIVTWRGENGAYFLSAAFQPGEYPAACRNADDANAWAASIGLNLRFRLPGEMILP